MLFRNRNRDRANTQPNEDDPHRFIPPPGGEIYVYGAGLVTPPAPDSDEEDLDTPETLAAFEAENRDFLARPIPTAAEMTAKIEMLREIGIFH